MKVQQSSSVKKVLILAVILALPGFCYYLLQDKGKNSYKPLPKYGDKELTGTFHSKRGVEIPDTAFHKVDAFEMHALPDGAPLVFSVDSGVCVVGFFSLTNRVLADKINGALNKMAMRFEKNGMVRFVSIGIDSIRDGKSELAQYASSFGYRGDHWTWLYGKGAAGISSLSQEQFLLDVVPDDKGGFIQGSKVALLDSHHRIRGFYDTTLPQDVDRLFDEIKLLLTEEIRNISVNKNE